MKAFLIIFSLLGTLAVFGEAVLLCYWGAWANSRTGVGRYGVSDIPTDLCDYVVYSFIGLNSEGEITFLNDQDELEGKSNLIEDFIALKKNNTNLKLIAACGGWTEGTTNFTAVVNNETLRATFVSNVVSYINKTGFDGFAVDWEYPNQRGGVESDKEAFVYLLQELKTGLSKISTEQTVGVAVGVSEDDIEESYLVPNISAAVDYIHFMTYDFHGSWDTVTGVNSPLYRQLTDAEDSALNVNASVHLWLDAGADPAKMLLGMGSYGHTFILNSTDTSTGASVSGAGTAGPYTDEAGTYAYYEICMSQQANSTWNITEVTGNYVYGNLDTFWVGYDNENTIAAKAKYAKNLGLGGIFFWSLDLDDFSGQCGSTTYPLIRAAKTAFNAD